MNNLTKANKVRAQKSLDVKLRYDGVDYDDFYFEDVKNTIETLQMVINNSEEGDDFIYNSSW